ncbi:MAG TPA: hypothetical protein DCZ94_14045 [Lentisphaeria bacterium]|nr:MAG: hypothetical protein A2X48_03865 [Lentisphaerae bacterium GWF2_49_21]HBC88067.1 hypothetical protein [Lentisphaeria bacterium]
MPLNIKAIPQNRPNTYRRYFFRQLCLGGRNSSVIVQKVNQGDTLQHSHDFDELVFVLGGSATHAVGKNRNRIEPGDFFLVDSKMKHAYLECRDFKLSNVLIRKNFINNRKGVLSLCHGYRTLFSHMLTGRFIQPANLTRERLDECLSLVNRIEREQFEPDAASDEMSSLLLLQLLITACRYSESRDARIESRWSGLGKVIPYMQSHCHEDMNLGKLCSLACMSKRSFIRYFSKTAGCTPIQYLLKIRISKASRLLRERGDMPLSEVAVACGFDDANYFSRAFRKCTGIPPNRFRSYVSIKENLPKN